MFDGTNVGIDQLFYFILLVFRVNGVCYFAITRKTYRTEKSMAALAVVPANSGSFDFLLHAVNFLFSVAYNSLAAPCCNPF